ncbi:MAG: hypothetical protein ACLU6D_08555, partial [Gordonibacter urolithinfaciens]
VLARSRDGRVDQLFKLFANLHGAHLSCPISKRLHIGRFYHLLPARRTRAAPPGQGVAAYAEKAHMTSQKAGSVKRAPPVVRPVVS